MKRSTLLYAPWHANSRATRGFAAVAALVVALGAGALGVGLHASDAGAQRAMWAPMTAFVLAFGAFFLVMLMLAPLLLLAIDARRLRVPRLQREAGAAVLLYAALGVLVPTLLLGVPGGRTAIVAGLLALAIAAGLAVALLPRALSVALALLPAVYHQLPPALHAPAPMQPGFPLFALAATAVLAVAAAIGWSAALRRSDPYRQGWWAPLVLQFRLGDRGVWSTRRESAVLGGDERERLRRQPAWLQPRADVSRCGPAEPVRSLRVALGPSFVPMTTRERLRQIALLIGSGLLFVGLFVAQYALDGHHRVGVDRAGGLATLLWFGGFGGSMLAASAVMQVLQRWSRTNAELPLLALLPGLGDASAQRRHLLRAGWLPPLRAQLALLLGLSVLALWMHASWRLLGAVALSQLGGIGFLLAYLPAAAGGRTLPTWASATLAVYGFALMMITLSLPLLGEIGLALLHGGVLTGFVVAWAALVLALGWIGMRGWRALRQRPHPFLPT